MQKCYFWNIFYQKFLFKNIFAKNILSENFWQIFLLWKYFWLTPAYCPPFVALLNPPPSQPFIRDFWSQVWQTKRNELTDRTDAMIVPFIVLDIRFNSLSSTKNETATNNKESKQHTTQNQTEYHSSTFYFICLCGPVPVSWSIYQKMNFNSDCRAYI